jgi:hypothetical protein
MFFSPSQENRLGQLFSMAKPPKTINHQGCALEKSAQMVEISAV